MAPNPTDKPISPVSSAAGGPADESAGQPPSPTRAETLLRIEETKLKEGAVAETMSELQRHRIELIEQLGEVVATLEEERRRLDEIQSELTVRRNALVDFPAADPADAELTIVRHLKHEVHAAHMELLKHHKSRLQGPENGPSFSSLSFAQLTRIGMALTWPVILALLVGAALVAFALVSLLG